MQIIERIREETELLGALDSLPRGIDNIYIRLLAAIPESDRLFVRQALLWIIGHASSPWLRDNGIHINLLVSAVCNDLLSYTGKSYRYTAEDLLELCGCLITVRAEPLPFTDFLSDLHFDEATGDVLWTHRYPEEQAPIASFVEIAHRTVVDFLFSERIGATTVQSFSMTWTEVTNTFFKSVLRQALEADSASKSADWIRDREAYSLTLVPAMIPYVDELDEATLDAYFAYFLPTSPHFPRLRLIQYYLCGGCSCAQLYFLARLPVHHPGLPASHYQANDPYAWAMLGMMATENLQLARALQVKIGWDDETAAAKELTFGLLEEVVEGQDITVRIRSHVGKLQIQRRAHCHGQQLWIIGGSR